MRQSGVIGLLIGCLATCSTGSAETGLLLNRQQRENQHRLLTYTWRSRVEYRVGGRARRSETFFARYDASGALVRTRGGGTASPSPRVLTPPLEYRISTEEERLDEAFGAVTAEIHSYESLTAEQQQAALQRAHRETGTGDLAGTEKLTVTGILRPEDSAAMWLDRKTKLQRRLELTGLVGRDPFRAVYAYSRLEHGTVYPAKVRIDVPTRGLEIVVENSSYRTPGI